MNEIELLKARVIALENENQQLKALLRNAGINCSDIDSPKEQNQGERIIPETITQNHPRLFFSYFWGRLDVYSKRFQNKTTGKTGYFPQCDNFWRKGICPKSSGAKIKCKDCSNRCWTKLDSKQIEKHLIGAREDASDVIGIYPLFPDGTCRLLALDAEGKLYNKKVMRLSVTLDHRLLDGAVVAKFEMDLRDLLQSPMSIVL